MSDPGCYPNITKAWPYRLCQRIECQSQMTIDVHAPMQYSDNVRTKGRRPIINDVPTNRIFPISLANVVATPSPIGFVNNIAKAFVNHPQVAVGLVFTPLIRRVVPNGLQI